MTLGQFAAGFSLPARALMLVTVSFNFCMFTLPLAACRVVLSVPSLIANDTSLSGQLRLLTLN